MNVYPRNFSREELLHSNTGNRLGIENLPDGEITERNIVRTAELLQAIRDGLSKEYARDVPIKVLSGYRCRELNEAVGGSKSSAHKQGLAADIVADGVSVRDLAHFVHQNFPIADQVILEFPDSEKPWVHVGLSDGKPRSQALTANKENGRTIYRTGFV